MCKCIIHHARNTTWILHVWNITQKENLAKTEKKSEAESSNAMMVRKNMEKEGSRRKEWWRQKSGKSSQASTFPLLNLTFDNSIQNNNLFTLSFIKDQKINKS